MAQLRPFNPIQNLLAGQEVGIRQQEFEQSRRDQLISGELEKIKFMNSAAKGLLQIPPEQWPTAYRQLLPMAQQLGIDPGQFPADQVTKENLLALVASTEQFIQDPNALTAAMRDREDMMSRLPIDPTTGQLKPREQWTAAERVAAMDAGLEAKAGTYTAAERIPQNNQTDIVADSRETIKESEARGTGRGKNTAQFEADLVPAYQSAYYSMNQSGEAADTARELLEHPGFDAAFGIGGATLSRIPETDAAEARALLDQLKNRTFITALQAMRQASKTGGAVGNVSEKEGDRMENAFTALSQAQGPEQARRELQNFLRIMEESQRRVKEAFQLQYGNTEGFDKLFGKLPEPGAATARRSKKNLNELSDEELLNAF